MLDLMSDDHVARYAAIFWWEDMKNYNLLLSHWKVQYTFIIYMVFGIEKSIVDVKFAVQ